MKVARKLLRLALIVSLPWVIGGASPRPSGSLLITGVSIVSPDRGDVTPPRDVLIVDGRIVEVAETIARESAAAIIPAEGLYAMPGLIDVHTHQGDGGLGEISDADREGVMRQFLRYGVTSILNLGGGGGTEEELARWKDRCGSGEVDCPDVYGTGVIITAPGSHPISTLWNFAPETDPQVVYERGAIAVAEDEDVGPLLDRKVSMGVDAVKIVIEDWDPDDPTPRLSRAKVGELAQASHERGLRVYAHVSTAEHVEDAIAGGVDGVVHSAEDRLSDALLETMARRGMFYVPTLSLYDGLVDRARGLVGNQHEPYATAGVSKRALDSLADFGFSPFSGSRVDSLEAVIFENLRRASAAGVPIALGTDVDNPSVFPGYSAHEELELMVAAGLTPAQALAAATTGSAAFLGKQESLGRIAVGHEADLLLLRRNPLEDILHTRSIYSVIHDGRVLDDVVSAHDGGPIIDMHLHAFGWDEYGDPPPPDDVVGERPAARSDQEALEATLAEMDRYGIVLGVASGQRVPLWLEGAPGRFLGGSHLSVRKPFPEAESLREAFVSGRLAVHGELGLQYLGMAPDDPKMEPHYELAEELDIPVALHTGLGPPGSPYGCCPGFRTNLGNPALLEEVLVRHPKLRIYLMHAGYPWLQETLALLYMYPQVHVDIGVLSWTLPRAEFNRHLEALMTAGFGKRVLFGSDQMIWPWTIGMAVEAVEEAPFLTLEQKRDIFYWNAARFLRLSDEEIERHHLQVGASVPDRKVDERREDPR